MLTSYQEAESAGASRRGRLLKVFLLLVIAATVIVAMICTYLVQPLVFPITRAESGSSVDPARLEAHVRALCERFGPRDVEHPQNLDRCAEYIRAELELAGGRVSDQPFERDGVTYRNIVASFGPESGEIVVVGAHYDTAGPRPGADDNASGVAGLIELAGLLGRSELTSRVELVAYTLEEPPVFRSGQMGSAVHARSLAEKGTQVRIMIGLEMIGYFSDAPDSQRYPIGALGVFYPSTGNFISVVGRVGGGNLVRTVKRAMTSSSPLPVYSINAPSFVPGIDFSDHLNYWNEGFPAVMVSDTSFYRNRMYHTIDDTPDTLDYRRMSHVVVGVHAAVVELAR
ncbi:MAG: M28 family peptidase [Blastocatellia bacterium]